MNAPPGRIIPYRPEIDGLRGIAVLAVVAFHAGFPGFAGGFVGVDVFFVISGYLIASLLLKQLTSGDFSMRAFYERRARRILPAPLFVVLASAPALASLMDPPSLVRYARTARAAALCFANIVFWREAGYFETSSALKPLLHTWSLSVEEQYYLIFPLVFAALWRSFRHRIAWLTLAVMILSFIAASFVSAEHPGTAFYTLLGRAWELLGGAALAMWARPSVVTGRRRRIDNAASVVGVALIAVSVFALRGETAGPTSILVAVIGTVLILYFAREGGVAFALLARRPIVGLGLISYSLYLWHHVVFVAARLNEPYLVTPRTYVALSLVSALLGWLTWRWIETPARHGGGMSPRTAWTAIVVGLICAVGLGAAGVVGRGFPGRFAAADIASLPVPGSSDFSTFRKHGVLCWRREVPEACVLGDESLAPAWAVVGDSIAATLAPALDGALLAERAAAIELVKPSCVYLGAAPAPASGDCAQWSAAARRRLLADPAIQHVVIAGRYARQFFGKGFDNGEGGQEDVRFAGWINASPDLILEGIAGPIRELLGANKQVIVIYPIPEVGWVVPQQLFKLRAILHRSDDVTTDFRRYLERTARIRAALDQLGNVPGLVRVQPADWLCDAVRPGRCVTELGGTPQYLDQAHPSPDLARRIVNATLVQSLTPRNRSVDHKTLK